MEGLILLLLALFVSLLVSAFFSGAETAVISANRFRLRERHEAGSRAAGRTLDLLVHTHRLISATLIGNNIANVMSALLFKELIERLWPVWARERVLGVMHWSEALGILVLTPVVVLFAEILPKAIFRARADAWIVAFRPVLSAWSILFTPVIRLLDMLVSLTLMPLGGRQSDQIPLTRADIIMMLNPPPDRDEEREAAAVPAGAAEQSSTPEDPPPAETPSFMRDPDERTLIRNIIQLDHTYVAEIMRPLVELEAIALEHVSLPEFLETARRSGYSRFPVYRRRILRIVGYIDLYEVIRHPDPGSLSLESFVREAYYVPETKEVDDLLQEFLARKLKVAVVVNEYGGCTGWVTMEDILEEIVGELEDELDLPDPLVEELTGGAYRLDGRIKLDYLNEVLGLELDEPYCDTLGGLMMKELGHIPLVGEEVETGNWTLRIEEMEKMRVKLVKATPRLAEEEGG